jgi:uncharacterized membrane protein YebE (DUF533 family)
MFDNLLFNIAMGALRHALTAGGGAMVADGILTSAQSNWAVGAVVALVGLAWSGWEKWQAQKSTGTTGAVVRDTPVEVKDLPPVQ